MDRREQIEKLKALARENGLMPELLGNGDDVAAVLNSQRPKIRLPGDNREHGQFATEVGEIVKARDLFRRDITPVIVNAEKKRLDLMTSEMLRTWVETHLVCFKDKKVGQGEDTITIQIMRTMNVDTARATLAAWQFWSQLPEIERVNPTRLPVLRRDGRIELLTPGYFGEQGIYTLDDGLVYDETMTVDRAKEVLDDLLSEFPFHDDGRSKAVVLAAMLTMFAPGLMPRRALRPGFIYTANSVTAGKTLLAKFAICPVCGSAAVRSLPRKEEQKKVLDVLAMNAASYVLFDNIRGKISGEDVEGFITSSEWEGRLLGESTNFRVDNVTTVFLTGNQSTTSPDMASRCLFVELFVEEADVTDRKIRRVIDDDYLASIENRSLICSALWTLVRKWDAEGRPAAPSVLPRFESWANTIAAIVHCAGYGDACAKPEIAGAGDEEMKDMRQLVIALAPAEDEERVEWEFADVAGKIRELGLFEHMELRGVKGESEDMFSEDGKVSPKAKSLFGKLLTRFDQRLFAGGGENERLRFIVAGKGNSRRYVVARENVVTPAPAVSSNP